MVAEHGKEGLSQSTYCGTDSRSLYACRGHVCLETHACAEPHLPVPPCFAFHCALCAASLQVVGRYNWTLAMSVFGPQQTPYVHRHSVHRVLVLHPSINLARTRSMEEYNTIVLGLMLVRPAAQGGHVKVSCI